MTSEISTGTDKKVESMDGLYSRKHQLFSKNRKLRAEKNELDRK